METLFSDDGLFAPPGRSLQIVKLERSIDAQKLCCNNIAFVCEGKPPHAAELRCARCDSHRGWLPREALDFITSTTERIGAPAQPIILRDHSIGNHTLMEKKFDDTNRGALFKNDRKTEEKDADYSGTINFNGVECWLNAWIKTSKAGKKFMSLSVKPKEGTQSRASSVQ
jgi:hypothetical protein